MDRLPEALAEYNKAVAIDPTNIDAYLHKGFVLDDLNRTEEAIAAYDEAIAIKPTMMRL